jgi:hypothetical protein
MASVAIGFTPNVGSPVYSVTFSEFTDNAFPRSYLSEIAYEQSVSGASILGGPAYVSKYSWTISSVVLTPVAETFDNLYQDWDLDRSNGYTAACGVIDTTFGATVNTSAVFTTAPTYNYWGPAYTLVSFGMTEV